MQIEQELKDAIRPLAPNARIEVPSPEMEVRIGLDYRTQLLLSVRGDKIESKCTIGGQALPIFAGVVLSAVVLLGYLVATIAQSKLAVFFSVLPGYLVLRWCSRVLYVRDFARGVLWRRWGPGVYQAVPLHHQLVRPRPWLLLGALVVAAAGFWFLLWLYRHTE